MIVLTLLRKLQFPVMAECITPEAFKGKTVEEMAAFPIWEGNKQKKLGDIFKIAEETAETPNITINGDAAEVKHVAAGMKEGEILINGNIGMHLGEKMSGGKITVNGNTGSWAGAELKGGLIEIYGNAGDYLASPYRGSDAGMRGGKIIVHGNVGTDSAVFMKKGVIKILGDAGLFLGFQMRGGAIHVEKNVANRVGAGMTGGKIVVSGFLEEVMPTFTIDTIKPKVKIDETESVAGPFYVFLGDLAENGTGKLFVLKKENPQLRRYERFL